MNERTTYEVDLNVFPTFNKKLRGLISVAKGYNKEFFRTVPIHADKGFNAFWHKDMMEQGELTEEQARDKFWELARQDRMYSRNKNN